MADSGVNVPSGMGGLTRFNEEYKSKFNLKTNSCYWIHNSNSCFPSCSSDFCKMIPGVNPKQMQAMMKQMGMSQTEIPSSKVIIEKEDGEKLVINNPSVMKIKIGGQESFQITGDISEESGEKFSESDVKVVMEKTNCSEKEAQKALEETGDLADAIMKLSE